MFEISNIRCNYADFTLSTRSVDCSTITREDFIKMLMADIKEADATYKEISIPRQIEIGRARYAENVEKNRKRTLERAEKYAISKWKTEKRRNQHMQEVIAKLESDVKEYKPMISDLSFLDFNGNCGTTMGINCNCVISLKELSDERLGICFDSLLKTKYFRMASGWLIGYEGDAESYRSCFRPYIKLTFDEKTTKEVKEAQDSLTRSVMNFYANTNYWGD